MNPPKTRPIAVVQKDNTPISITQSYGGTLYGETPGGTKIKYTIEDFKNLSKSPMCQKAPIDLPDIPGLTRPLEEEDTREGTTSSIRVEENERDVEEVPQDEEDDVFDMEM